MINREMLKAIMPYASPANLDQATQPLSDAMDEFEINTPRRAAAFLAQIAHESGSLRYTHELASGAEYEGRKDLGNTQPGDGAKFKGRGYIQLTGRSNTQAYADYKGMTLDETLDYLSTVDGAANVSGWFWDTRSLNQLADEGDFRGITRRINGGFNGLAAREAYYARAQAVLGDA